MATLYITEEYAVIKKRSQRLFVEKDGKELLGLPFFKVDRILLFGNIQVTADAVQHLLDNKIDIAFFNQYGRLKGKLSDTTSKNVYLRVAQVEAYLDETRRFEIAKSIVEGKIKNIIAFLRRYQRNHPSAEFGQSLVTLENCLKLLERKKHVSGCMGIEGIATGVYFRCFPALILNEAWKSTFCKRVRRPPTDPVNAMLSLGYSLITNELWALLDGMGFDPFVGLLHGINYGRPSLAVDLVEEFRIPLVDRTVIELINNRVIKQDDFETIPHEGCKMKKDSLKKFFSHFDRRIQGVFIDPETREETNYRKMFYKQAQKLSKSIQQCIEYRPFSYL